MPYYKIYIPYIFFRYEMAKKMLGNQNSLDEIILAAFGAGSICTLITNPISVVRSRILLTDRDKRNNKYLSISSTLKQIIKNEGFQGLYKVSTIFWVFSSVFTIHSGLILNQNYATCHFQKLLMISFLKLKLNMNF